MYLPQRFAENDRSVALSLMTADGFATVITPGDVPEVSHVPTLVAEAGGGVSIEFHLALANPQARRLIEGSTCTIVYLGPHCYVSPSWYTEHPNVPTWNYLSVEAVGPVSILGPTELEAQLGALAAKHEPCVGGTWGLDQIPAEYKQQLLREIRGYRVSVTSLRAKSKLSQNRIPIDRQRVTRRLLDSADPAAQAVGRRMEKKFGTPDQA